MPEHQDREHGESELIREAKQLVNDASTHRESHDTKGHGTVVRCPHCGERIPLQPDIDSEVIQCPNC